MILQVNAGMDRFQKNNLKIWGLLPLSIKLSGQDTDGALLVFEHKEIMGGGPPRHIHFAQDEWFYVVKSEFDFEIDGKMFRLGAGDTLFAPRNIAHGWAHVGKEPGTLITSVSPVGSFEDFILDTTKYASLPSPEEIEKAFSSNAMKVTGPPL